MKMKRTYLACPKEVLFNEQPRLLMEGSLRERRNTDDGGPGYWDGILTAKPLGAAGGACSDQPRGLLSIELREHVLCSTISRREGQF